MKTGKKIYLSKAVAFIPNYKPIVFWDTCALLDIIRIPIRENLALNQLECYEKLAEYIDNDLITSVTSGLVVKEFVDHFQDENVKLIQAQQKLKDKVIEYAQFMSNRRKKDRIVNAVGLLNVEHRLNSALNRIWSKTFILMEENKYRDFADYRLRNKMAPAARKSEYKDCYIWGTFIKLVHTITPTSSYVAFATVNTKDYMDKTQLHNHIKTDCDFSPSMRVILNIGQLYSDLHHEIEEIGL